MTNFIEEMMKTAGVKKCEHFRQYNYAQVSYGKEELKKSQDNGIECIRIRNCTDENNTCIYWTELFYPSFTAEKQLELIKLVSYIDCLEIFITEIPSYRYVFNLSHRKVRIEHKTFIEALAQLTTELMNAGELDKEKVRDILQC